MGNCFEVLEFDIGAVGMDWSVLDFIESWDLDFGVEGTSSDKRKSF